ACTASRSAFIVVFFASRRRHTRLVSDWSSDVCSSDLISTTAKVHTAAQEREIPGEPGDPFYDFFKRFQNPGNQGGDRDQIRRGEIGRASCRERAESAAGAVRVKQKVGADGRYGATCEE